jgi:hypothetical protein
MSNPPAITISLAKLGDRKPVRHDLLWNEARLFYIDCCFVQRSWHLEPYWLRLAHKTHVGSMLTIGDFS